MSNADKRELIDALNIELAAITVRIDKDCALRHELTIQRSKLRAEVSTEPEAQAS